MTQDLHEQEQQPAKCCHQHLCTLPLKGRVGALQHAAAKSHWGHAEAGAGVLGLHSAMSWLAGRFQQHLLHLRTINPHVASTVESASTEGTILLPRQASCTGNINQTWHAGVSAFAFQVWCPCLPYLHGSYQHTGPHCCHLLLYRNL